MQVDEDDLDYEEGASQGSGELEVLHGRVPVESGGQRFDVVLTALFPQFSRSRLSEWIKSGDAQLDGASVKPKQSVRGGESVVLRAQLTTEVADEPEPIELDIVYQDSSVLVINKPAGLVVHPGAGNRSGTLVNALLHFDPALAQIPRAGIVHRLDKDTSGLMVVARTLPAHTSLVEQLSGRNVRRQYLALVFGNVVAGTTIRANIGRHPTDRLRQAVVEAGKEAVTHYRVREKFRSHSLLECRLETGRTHQIRVHLAYIKYPIVGDPVYGGSLRLPKASSDEMIEILRGFKRQALHAESLAFVHPVSGEQVAFEAPVPQDMQRLLGVLRADQKAATGK